jgi:hypothetical protein
MDITEADKEGKLGSKTNKTIYKTHSQKKINRKIYAICADNLTSLINLKLISFVVDGIGVVRGMVWEGAQCLFLLFVLHSKEALQQCNHT